MARMRNPEHVLNMVMTAVKPILEDWSKIKLMTKVGVYGFRRYLRGSVLRMHVDRLPTHILSAILQVRLIGNYVDSWRHMESHGDS